MRVEHCLCRRDDRFKRSIDVPGDAYGSKNDGAIVDVRIHGHRGGLCLLDVIVRGEREEFRKGEGLPCEHE